MFSMLMNALCSATERTRVILACLFVRSLSRSVHVGMRGSDVKDLTELRKKGSTVILMDKFVRLGLNSTISSKKIHQANVLSFHG